MSLVDDNQRADALAVLRGLIGLLADPEATRGLLDRLEQAHAQANEARAAVKQLRAEQAQLRSEMAAEAEQHHKTLSDETLRHNDEFNRQRNEIAKAEAAVKAVQETAETDARAAAALRQKFQNRVDAVDSALGRVG